MYKCIERLRSCLDTKTVFKNREYPKIVSITWNNDLMDINEKDVKVWSDIK